MEILLPDILADLAIISSINEGDTLTSNDGKIQVISHDGAGAQRRWKGESRATTVSTVEKKIMYSIEYSTLIMESIYLHSLTKLDSFQKNSFNKRISSLERINIGLENSKSGIQKLCRTYDNDRGTQGKIRTIIGNIEFQISVIKSKLNTIQRQIENQRKNNSD